MFDFLKKSRTDVLDKIENAVYEELKPHGFRRFGRTLHRFVSGDISQVIDFQQGEVRHGENHLLYVNVGIRVPECEARSFAAELEQKKYYHEYDCNIRCCLKEIEGQKEDWYDLHDPVQEITNDILRQLRDIVIPAFLALDSRPAILENRRHYRQIDAFNGHLILLEEAMIFGRAGDLQRAEQAFNQYYDSCAQEYRGHEGWRSYQYLRAHLNYLAELAETLDIPIHSRI